MEEVQIFPFNYGEAVKRRLPVGVSVGISMLIATALLAVALPSYFKSRAVILIEAQEMPQDLVRSLVTSFADQRIQVISQRVLTNSNLSSIIDKYGLYAAERKHDPLEAVLEMMRKDITVNPISADVADPKVGRSIQATIAFELAYESKSPALAQKVANEIVSLFLSENLRQRKETSEQSLTFLSDEAHKLRTEVLELEQKLATFKEGNVQQLPELTNLNIEMINRTEGDIRALDSQIQSLQQQKVYLESELAQQRPMIGTFSENGDRILGPADRLKILEAEFSPLAARYGASHPDVIAKKREIEALRKEVGGSSDQDQELILKLKDTEGRLAVLKQKYSETHPDVRKLSAEVENLRASIQNVPARVIPQPKNSEPDNPAYIQLKARLEGTDSDLSSLQSQRGGLHGKLADLEKRIANTPEVERKYRELTRDYENAQRKYEEVLAKKQEAEVASNLENEQKGERFTLIEPPATPEEPSKPNRLAIALLGVVASLASAFGIGVLLERFDDRVHGRNGIGRILGVAPLAVIPRIMTPEMVAARVRTVVVVSCTAIGIIVAAILAINFFIRPIDVIFFQVARRLFGYGE